MHLSAGIESCIAANQHIACHIERSFGYFHTSVGENNIIEITCADTLRSSAIEIYGRTTSFKSACSGPIATYSMRKSACCEIAIDFNIACNRQWT